MPQNPAKYLQEEVTLEPGSRSEKLFLNHVDFISRRTDRLFAKLMIAQWLVGILAALILTPLEWAGTKSIVHINVWAAIFLGGILASLPVYLSLTKPGHVLTRHIVAISQALFSALLIHLTGGRIETHFHVFGSIAFLAFYRDWKVILSFTLVTAVDHFVRGVWWPSSVFGVLSSSSWRWLEHAAWVAFEDFFIIRYCRDNVREMRVIAKQQADLENSNELVEKQVREQTRQLRLSEKKLSSIVNHINGIVWEADPKTQSITFVSQQAERMLGYPLADLTEGNSFRTDIIHPDDRERALETGRRNFSQGTSYDIEYRMVTKGGNILWIHDLVSVEVVDGVPSNIQGVMIDITERKRSDAELRAANERIEEANALLVESLKESKRLEKDAQSANLAKSEFLATMSHEIRTPMNGVIGFTSLLLDSELSEEQREYADTIKNSSQVLLGLINDILDISKIEANKLAIEELEFDLPSAVDAVAEILSPHADEKGIELAIKFQKDMCSKLVGDFGRVRQVMTNLVSNAIKFTPKGHIFIRVEDDSSDPQKIRVIVEDTGIGISKEKLATLFESFTQADSSTTRKYGGTGLGLSISKKLVHLMGGEIGADSVPGVGSTFWFTLPRKLTPTSPDPINVSAALIGKKILVADDHQINRDLIRDQLDDWELIPVCVTSGKEAIETLTQAAEVQSPFDFALLDLILPDVDCEDLRHQIQSKPKLAQTKLIAAGSGSHRKRLRTLLDQGFHSTLLKPLIRPKLLLESLEIASSKSDIEIPETTTKATDSEAELPAAEVENTPPKQLKIADDLETSTKRKLKILLAEDHVVNQRLAAKFLKRLGHIVDIANNGREALEMSQKIRYDAILMDCQMPEMSGLEATKAIREREQINSGSESQLSRRTPIIAVTAGAMEGDRSACIEAGMDDYLSKPLRPKDLSAAIEHWCKIDEPQRN